MAEDSNQKNSSRLAANALFVVIFIAAVAASGFGATKLLAYLQGETAPVTARQADPFRLIATEPIQDVFSAYDTQLAQTVQPQVYEGLVGFSAGKTTPLLANAWKQDATSWEFSLRPNVSFHTGKIMSVQDVKASLDLAVAQGTLPGVSLVEAVGEDVIRIQMKGERPALLEDLAKIWIFDTTMGSRLTGSSGTGPYRLERVSGAGDMLFEYFPGYHGAEPKIKSFTLSHIRPEGVKATLSTGQADMIIPGEAPLSEDIAGFAVHRLSGGKALLSVNPNRPAFKSNEMRQALFFALDRDEIIAAAKAQPLPPASGMVRQADPAKTKALLSSAPKRSKAIIVLSHLAADKPVAEALKRQLTSMQIPVRLDSHASAASLQKRAAGGTSDLILSLDGSVSLPGAIVLYEKAGSSFAINDTYRFERDSPFGAGIYIQKIYR